MFGVSLSGGATDLKKSQYLLLDQRVIIPMKRVGHNFAHETEQSMCMNTLESTDLQKNVYTLEEVLLMNMDQATIYEIQIDSCVSH